MKRVMLLPFVWLSLAAPAAADELAMPEAPTESTAPATYTVVKGDTLWDLSARFYGNPWEWPTIWKANPQIADPHWIYPGNVLTIPGKEGAPQAAAPEPMPEPTPEPATEPAPAVAAVPAPVPAPAAAPAPVAVPAPAPAIPSLSEKMPTEPAEYNVLSEEMPPQLTGGDLATPMLKVSTDWEAEGRIVADEWVNAIDGEVVGVKFSKDTALKPGDRLHVVLHGGYDKDKKGKKTAALIQKIAEVKVTEVQGDRKVQGIIERAKDGVQNGHGVVTQMP